MTFVPSAERTIAVNSRLWPSLASGAIFNVFAQPTVLLWPGVKAPSALLDYSLDMTSDLLDGGDTVASTSLSIAPSGSGELSASGLTLVGDVLTVWFAGGVPGRFYEVNVEAITLAARTFQYTVGLMCDPTFATVPLPAPPNSGFGTPVTWSTEAIVVGPPLRLVATGLVATGTDQASALPLTALTNVFASAAAGTGGQLPSSSGGSTLLSGTIVVVGNPLTDTLIYPPNGAAIGSASVNIPVIVSANERVNFMTESPTTQWYSA